MRVGGILTILFALVPAVATADETPKRPESPPLVARKWPNPADIVAPGVLRSAHLSGAARPERSILKLVFRQRDVHQSSRRRRCRGSGSRGPQRSSPQRHLGRSPFHQQMAVSRTESATT
jgi:hypothetical protein